MQNNPEKTLKDVFEFLKIPEYTIKKPQKQKANEYKKMKSQTRDRLLEFYKEHNEKFFEIIKKRFELEFLIILHNQIHVFQYQQTLHQQFLVM